jgi:tRNA pseudouridine55 synthase
MATGVLLVCLGQATRLIEYLVLTRKQYRAVVSFGTVTDTLDAEGEIVAQNSISSLTAAKIQEVLPTFMGEIKQIPPIFSAIKHKGQPLYKRARAGEVVEVEPRQVTIYNLDWVGWQPPDLTLDVTCSSGTYIRSLARDLGEATGTGACLTGLIRTANGDWSLDQAVTLDQLEQAAKEFDWKKYLQPPDQGISHIPGITLNEDSVQQVKHGRRIQLDSAELVNLKETETDLVRAYTPAKKFLAILKRVEAKSNMWQPKKVFN